MAYPEAGNMNTVKEIGGDYGNKAMCADSRFAVAGTTVSSRILLLLTSLTRPMLNSVARTFCCSVL
jgi:hypothetical protein